MKKTSTLFRVVTVFCSLLFLPIGYAFAQGPGVVEAVCEYDDGTCLFVAYESVQEESPTSDELVVVLTAFLNDAGSCSNIDGLIFTASDGTIATVTREALDTSAFVSLNVDRDIFTETPDILVATYRLVTIPGLGIEFAIPTDVVDLQARLDSENPCLTITPLPVELVSFKAISTPAGISLKWRTVSEKDNKQFEVERSADGLSFERLGIVPGHGTTAVPVDYSFDDNAPVSGTNYYRLKQVDLDGKYEYSFVVTAEGLLQNGRLVVAPNPCTNGNCSLNLARAGIRSETLLELKDLAGRVVFSKTVSPEDNPEVKLDELSRFKGLYLLSVTSGNKVISQRLMLE